MLHRTLIGSFVLVAALPAAAAAQGVTATSRSAERAVRAADSVMLHAVAARDVDKVTAMFAADAVVMHPHAPAATGAAIRKGWADVLGLPGAILTWTPTQVNVAASGDLAHETGSYALSYDSPNGKVNDAGSFVTVWRKDRGQWKVLTDAAASNTPMNATMSMAPSGMADAADMEVHEASALTWTDMAVPGFAPGMKMAAVHGDPSKAGNYVMRLQFPDGYEFPLHWHPGTEQLTVLSGSFHLAMEGTGGQSAMRTYAPGDYLYIPAHMAHAGGAKGVTVIQLHGMGPFAINLGSAR